MAAFGRFVAYVDSRGFLSARNNIFKISQNFRQKTTQVSKSKEFIELPLKPKKPQSSFILYLQNTKSKLMEAEPTLKMPELIRKASQNWRAIDPVIKESYKNQYDEKYKQYVADLKEYNESLTDEQKLVLKEQKRVALGKEAAIRRKEKMDMLQKPKKPKNSFLLFLASKREFIEPNKTNKEWVQTVTYEWKSITDADKEVYKHQALHLMKQYKEDLAAWEKDMIQLGHVDAIRQSKRRKFLNTLNQQS